MTDTEKKLAAIEARLKVIQGSTLFDNKWEDIAYLLSELRQAQEELRRVRHEAKAEAFEEALIGIACFGKWHEAKDWLKEKAAAERAVFSTDRMTQNKTKKEKQ